MKRTLITLLAVAIAIGVAVAFMSSQDKQTAADKAREAAAQAQRQETQTPPTPPAPAATSTTPDNTATPQTPAPAGTPASTGGEPSPADKLPELTVLEAAEIQPEPPLGSDSNAANNKAMMRAVLSPWGAGVKTISLSQYSKVAEKHDPYIVQQMLTLPVGATLVPHYPLAAQSVFVNGQHLTLSDKRWQVVEQDADHAVFTITIADKAAQAPVLKIIRTYRLSAESYDLQLDQQFENLSDKQLNVQLVQLGQVDMHYEPSYMGDKRSVILGYFRPQYDPTLATVFIEGFDTARKTVVEKPEHQKLWPTEAGINRGYELSFVAETNRYFATAVHAPVRQVKTADGVRTLGTPLDKLFPAVNRLPNLATDAGNMAIQLTSAPLAIAPGKTAALDIGLFAGPKSPAVINDSAHPTYAAVGLQHLIIYNLGGCCSFLTFGWLAHFLLSFLTLLHAFLFDWGIAIILLVVIVRAILHPITKKSQLNMMKFSRQMQSMQPELEKIKKKYADDKTKLNAETMKLYREKGVNPAAMGAGCLPMLLQMPIWYALYAMLFYAIELRHQPAFYNVFHHIGQMLGFNWSFLTDLSGSDHFIMLGNASFTLPLLGWHVDSINVLPILMGAVFYLQQKYTTMTPTNASEMSDQQKTQMKMMKFMIFLFPVFLYKAPAGLNLYILASTAAGVVDSKIVRNHLKLLEERGELNKPTPKKQPKPGGFMDRLQKAAEAKRKTMEEAQRKGNKRGR